MTNAIYVTPVDEIEDGKTIVHVPLLVSMWAVRKIEDTSYFPGAAKTEKNSSAEPIANPPATLTPVTGIPVVQSTITFMDSVPMHVKESLKEIRTALLTP